MTDTKKLAALQARVSVLEEAIQEHSCGHCSGCEFPHPDDADGLRAALAAKETT